MTITAFSKETLDLYNIDTLESLSNLTPGLVISDAASGSGGQIAMRGVATGVGNTAFDQTVAVVFDGVAVNHAYIMKVAQLDMEQVEVLKGPQALYFGKNSPGGVISFRSSDPGDEFEMSVRAGYETQASEVFAEAVLSGPITDTLGGRLVVYRSDMDGWIDNVAVEVPGATITESSGKSKWPQREETFVRGTLVFEPNDSVTMRTKASLNDSESSSSSAPITLVFCPGGTDPLGSPCAPNDKGVEQLLVSDFVGVPGFPDDRRAGATVDWFIAGHEMDFRLNDNLTLSSITGYIESDAFTFADALWGLPAGLGVTIELDSEMITQELRLTSSNDGPVNFSIGAYYGDGEITNSNIPYLLGSLVGAPPGLLIPLNPDDPAYTVGTESFSVFGELIWDITDQLTLSAGARYTNESRSFNVVESGVDYSDRVVRDQDNDNTSPEISLNWRPTDNAMFFISYREGFKSGGHNQTFRVGRPGYASLPPGAGLDVSYEPETVEGIEAGFKLDLLDNRLRLNGAVFTYDYTDMQLSAFDTTSLQQSVLNAGESNIKGAEFDLLYLPEGVDGLSLSLGVAYTDSTFDRYLGGCYAGQTAAQRCIVDPVAGPQQDLAGRELLYAPDFSVTAGLHYDTKLSADWSLRSGATLSYSDSYAWSVTYDPNTEQDSYTKVNASITLGYKENWEFSLIGVNLTDEFTVGGGGPAPLLPAGTIGGVVSRGQQIMLQARWRL